MLVASPCQLHNINSNCVARDVHTYYIPAMSIITAGWNLTADETSPGLSFWGVFGRYAGSSDSFRYTTMYMRCQLQTDTEYVGRAVGGKLRGSACAD